MENQIEKDKYYSAKFLVDNQIVHWRSRMTFVKKLREKKYQDIFKPIIEKLNKSSRFYIKGEDIINYQKSKNK